MEYKVEYKDTFEEGEDEQIIFDWTLHKPIKVKSVTGLVDDERSEIVIELTNGDDKYMNYLEKWTHVVYTTLVLYKEKMYAC